MIRTLLAGAMDSNDSFSLALDGEGFTGLAGGHHALGPAPGLPHHGGPALGPAPGHAHYPGDHYDQPPPLPPHPVFSNCGEPRCWNKQKPFPIYVHCAGGMDDSAEYDPPSPDSWIGEAAPYPP